MKPYTLAIASLTLVLATALAVQPLAGRQLQGSIPVIPSPTPVPTPAPAPARAQPAPVQPARSSQPVLASWGATGGRSLQPDRLLVQRNEAAWDSVWQSLLRAVPRSLGSAEMGGVYVSHDGSRPSIVQLLDTADAGLEVIVKLEPCACSDPWIAFVTNLKSGRVFATLTTP